MNTTLWILQAVLALVFLYSGINKSIFSERKLVAKGQTGVEGLSVPFIKFIGVSEILGGIALMLPGLLNIATVLTPLAAIGLAIIMVPAGIIHYKRGEYKNVPTNCILFVMCLFVAYGQLFVVK